MNHTSKADKIRAIIAEQPNAKAKEIVEALAAKKVRVTLPQVYGLLSKSSKLLSPFQFYFSKISF